MKSRVAIVYPFIPHYRKPVFCELEKTGGKFDYVFFADKNSVDKSIKSTADGHGFVFRKASVFHWKGLLWQVGLFKVCAGSEFSNFIFLGNPYYISTWFYAGLARLFGKRVFFWTHGWLAKDKLLKRVLRNLFYRIPHGLMLYGDRAKSIGVEYGFPERSLHVIYNSLDYPAQCRVRFGLDALANPRSALPENLQNFPEYFACIARLTEECRFDLAIDALAILNKTEGKRIPLVLIGEGSARELLERHANEKNVELLFLGAIYDEEIIGPVIYNARIVVSPGKVGLTAMHALAYGTPVVTHSEFALQGPEVESIVDRVTGSVFHRGNVLELAFSMSYWVNRERSSAERNACIDEIENKYTPKRQVELISAALSS